MKRFIDNVWAGICLGTFTMLVFLGIWLMLVWFPVALDRGGECLEQGYAESRTTWSLKQYCVSNMGTIVVRK